MLSYLALKKQTGKRRRKEEMVNNLISYLRTTKTFEDDKNILRRSNILRMAKQKRFQNYKIMKK